MDETELKEQHKNEPERAHMHAGYRHDAIAKRKHVWLAGIVALLLVLIIAMASYGIGYQVSRRTMGERAGYFGGITMMRGGYGRGFSSASRTRPAARVGASGTVTAVSGTSMTINDTTRGGSVTYTLNSNTKVTQNGTTKAVSDIKTGDTVRVVAAGADTSIATSIAIVTAV